MTRDIDEVVEIKEKDKKSIHGPDGRRKAEIIESLNKVMDEEKNHRPVGHRKAQRLESQDKVMKKRLRYAAEAVEAQKRRNKILQAQDEMGIFTCNIDKNGNQALELMSHLREEALIRARSEVEYAIRRK